MRQNEFVYVSQFGGFWRLNDKQWREVLEAGATGDGYDLDAIRARRLRQQPSWARRNEDDRMFWSTRSDIRFFQPLDWEPEEFAAQLKEEGWADGS